jgi:hypothetical protein
MPQNSNQRRVTSVPSAMRRYRRYQDGPPVSYYLRALSALGGNRRR